MCNHLETTSLDDYAICERLLKLPCCIMCVCHRELAGYTDPRELYGRDCEKAIPHTRLAEYVLARYDTVEAIQADIDSDRSESTSTRIFSLENV